MENMNNSDVIHFGGLTYAFVDLPDDTWAWAIVSSYQGCQDYSRVKMAFKGGFEPESKKEVLAIMGALAALEG